MEEHNPEWLLADCCERERKLGERIDKLEAKNAELRAELLLRYKCEVATLSGIIVNNMKEQRNLDHTIKTKQHLLALWEQRMTELEEGK